jgi:hypothetical protein
MLSVLMCSCRTTLTSISVWAFEKVSQLSMQKVHGMLDAHYSAYMPFSLLQLAPLKFGVIGLQYRQVDCDYKPAKPLPRISEPTPGIPPPPGSVNPFDTPLDPNAPIITYSQVSQAVIADCRQCEDWTKFYQPRISSHQVCWEFCHHSYLSTYCSNSTSRSFWLKI